MSEKLVSFLIPTRKRVIYLKNSIDSILKNLKDTSKVEFIFRIDDDDDDTISLIKSLPFDNLYINNKKVDYRKNTNYNKYVDMHFIIGDRGNGYQDMHHHITNMYKISKGKWLFLWSDDVEMISGNWYEEIERLNSINKITVAKLSTWNICLIPREIPDVWGYVCPNQWMDVWYDEISKELDLYEDSNIIINHSREMTGITAIERERFFREIEKSPKWKNNHWIGGPPSYDIGIKNEHVEKLKKYIKNKTNMNHDDKFSKKLQNFFSSLDDTKIVNRNINILDIPDSITCNFINGPFVEILGNSNTEYTVEFIDEDTNEIVHKGIISPNRWIRANRQWYTNWHIKIYTNKLVFEHKFNAENKKVYVHLSSESIGDTIAWFPYVEEFRKIHNCKMVCSTFHNYLFENIYKDIEFVKPGTQIYNLYAMYEVGVYDGNQHRNRIDHKKIPLQQVSSDMLGIEFKEIRPTINTDFSIKNKISGKNKIPGKYVAISTESTAQCKLWNYPGGWQKVVDYLNKLGYKVVLVQKSKSDLINVIHRVENKDLNAAIDIINGAEFFIGISSGLSWIAWALQKKTIMISGFTLPWNEFTGNCYRIINIHSCKGCWHDYLFDKGNWTWCPMKKNFECSSTILPEHVYTQIQTIINGYDMMYTLKSPDVPVNLTELAKSFKFNDSRFEEAETMFFEIFRHRTYDFKQCFVKENDAVMDIGANIGVFTRYAIARGASEIYAFEPIKENYDIFVKNNNLPYIKSFNIGISDICGIEKFHLDGNSGGHTLLNTDPNNSRTKQIRDTECLTLNGLFENKIIPDKIDFIKIDAEGAEVKILEGISDENLKKIDKFAMEWHRFLFKDDSIMKNVVDRFSKLGYSFYIDYIGTELVTLYFWK